MKILGLAALLGLAACGGGDPEPAASTPEDPGPVVFIGDSITAYWPLPDGFINAGVPDETSVQMHARFKAEVLDLHPSVVMILAGTNDLRHLAHPTILDEFNMAAEAKATGARVILGALPPINDWSAAMPIGSAEAGDAAVVMWNRDLRLLGDAYGFEVANFHDAMVLADGSQNPDFFQSDRLHPNDAGYAVMRAVVDPLLHGN